MTSQNELRAGGKPPVWQGFGALILTMLLAFSMPIAEAIDKPAGKLVICYFSTHSALVPLAKQRGYYAAEGLDVEVRSLPSGHHTMEAMFAGQCPLATTGETPVAHASLSRNDFRIIATIAKSNNMESLIVRSDRGIFTPADLRGHRIATPQLTVIPYFLDIFLIANGLAPDDVIKVYLPAEDVASAFRRGDVDAAAHWKLTVLPLAAEFGPRVKTFEAPGLYVNHVMLVGSRDLVRRNPDVIRRVLRALLRAERFAREQPAAAKALVAQSYGIAPSEVDVVWPLHNFHVAIGQTLPFVLENAARWEIGRLPPAQRPALPNYLDFIDLDAMLAVQPAAVTIIH